MQQKFEIVIGTGGEPEQLLSGTFDDPETGGVIEVSLVRGGVEHEGRMVAEPRMGNSPMERMSVLANQRLAVGYLIQFVEQLDIAKEAAWEWVSDEVDTSGYREWVDSLTVEERRDRLIEQAETVGEQDPPVGKALEVGEWRNTDLSSESADLVKELTRSVDRNGRKCYETAQKEIEAMWEHEDRVKYCEGYVLPKQGVRGTRHAWVEVDGSVFELTWPWHAPVDGDAVYYGTEIPRDVLSDRMEERGSDPMILDENEWGNYIDMMDEVMG
ncbi:MULTISPECIES: hypothetical protein [Halorussus]|uniref:hypothetical protein n=1 Tax=Halorussus TaxID=1070314 RepID=UPI000E20CFFF|nr:MULTISPECIES: hypothetical protein [Halorussus]NHN60467.1 hypothetical protein [Halorussus sp. JP-T4]